MSLLSLLQLKGLKVAGGSRERRVAGRGMWHLRLLNYGIVGHLLQTSGMIKLYKIARLMCGSFNELMRIKQPRC